MGKKLEKKNLDSKTPQRSKSAGSFIIEANIIT